MTQHIDLAYAHHTPRLPTSPTTFLPTYLSIYLSPLLSVFLSLSIYLSFFLSIVLLSIYVFIHLSIVLSIYLYLATYLSMFLTFFLSAILKILYTQRCITEERRFCLSTPNGRAKFSSHSPGEGYLSTSKYKHLQDVSRFDNEAEEAELH